jgi:insertion element IS1 protein InsB
MFRLVLMEKLCNHCNGNCIKKGFNTTIQRFYCKKCKHHFQENYTYRLYKAEDEKTIVMLNNEGVGISSMSRITGISKGNIVNKIKQIASNIIQPILKEEHQKYEVDEMYTYIQSKQEGYYIIYGINQKTKQVINFTVGGRTKENINKVISSITELNPIKIYTDKLNVYPSLIGHTTHSTVQYRTNHIERFNLTIRTHLKRLTRKTICYSKSLLMLISCLKIYFYYNMQTS